MDKQATVSHARRNWVIIVIAALVGGFGGGYLAGTGEVQGLRTDLASMQQQRDQYRAKVRDAQQAARDEETAKNQAALMAADAYQQLGVANKQVATLRTQLDDSRKFGKGAAATARAAVDQAAKHGGQGLKLTKAARKG